ncbi:hypothetical protein Fot_43021 [Forsythia ovata]|uniref:Uncharacterized protein n=1 Tax=Forsythia ovata TaxID=205694 RepID=A0ABD1RRR3_9LAMI
MLGIIVDTRRKHLYYNAEISTVYTLVKTKGEPIWASLLYGMLPTEINPRGRGTLAHRAAVNSGGDTKGELLSSEQMGTSTISEHIRDWAQAQSDRGGAPFITLGRGGFAYYFHLQSRFKITTASNP